MSTKTHDDYTQVARIVFPAQGEEDLLPLYVDFGRAHNSTEPIDAGSKKARNATLRSLAMQRHGGEDHSALINGDSTMRLPGGLRVSFASVFNAFPASYWRQWTRATAARLEITIKGRASVLVYKSNAQGRFIRIDSAAVDSETVEFDVPLKTFADGGWIWFDVIASDEDAQFLSGCWKVNAQPEWDVSLSIGITTFNRPDYCAKTILALGEAENLKDILKRVYVVDQGNQFVSDDELYPQAVEALGDRLVMIHQGNMGGSGGFSRGMYESVQADETEFHMLLDDDVIVNPESVERLVRFASLCRKRTIVGGQMFDLNDRAVAHSFGEGINTWRWLWGPVPGTENRIDLALANLRQRRELHRRLDVDYNGWWMTLIPVSVIKEIGLSLPIFIKWDDLEYSLRASEHGVSTVTLPGAGLWHVAWGDKDDARDWQAYYHEHNRILTALLHSPYDHGGRLPYELTTLDVKHSVSAEYYAQSARLMAVRDILSGPEHLHRTLKTRMQQLREMTKNFTDAQYKSEPDAFPPINRLSRSRFKKGLPKGPNMLTLAPWTLKTLIRLMTPPKESAKQHPEGFVAHADSKYFILSQFDSVLVTKADGSGTAWYKRDPRKLRKLLSQSISARSQLISRWDELSAQYRQALAHIVSLDEWAKTFGITSNESSETAAAEY